MEKVLQKLARQLNAFDEASLMSLWDKYAASVSRFEPTKRWEEAAIVFGFIQTLRWKNQLFNFHWAAESRPGEDAEMRPPTLGVVDPLLHEAFEQGAQDNDSGPAKQRNKVLRFRPREGDEPV